MWQIAPAPAPAPAGPPRRPLGQALADAATIGIMQERDIRQGEVVAEQLWHAQQPGGDRAGQGVLVQHHQVSMDVPFERLRTCACNHNECLVEVARRAVRGELDLTALRVATRVLCAGGAPIGERTPASRFLAGVLMVQLEIGAVDAIARLRGHAALIDCPFMEVAEVVVGGRLHLRRAGRSRQQTRLHSARLGRMAAGSRPSGVQDPAAAEERSGRRGSGARAPTADAAASTGSAGNHDAPRTSWVVTRHGACEVSGWPEAMTHGAASDSLPSF